ncbi:MAG: response regulator transcription factor [Deltaproteobacteria bacterium]|nr:response regulator transcription factor [Deltaproteobacteria bacterium]
MYKWQQVKALRVKGESIKGIARQLNLSKNTVRKYLRSSGPPEFKRRGYGKMLDDYEGVIGEMLGMDYIGTRIYNELVEKGYKATTRVETAPGRQNIVCSL